MQHALRAAHQPAEMLSLTDAKRQIDAYLDDYFTTRSHEALAMSDSYGRLWQSLRQVYSGGGKRIRPYLVMLSYVSLSGQVPARVIPAAAAMELIHLAMLVHDDIIDRDTLRHGARNVSGQYDEFYRPRIESPPERRHFADSAALLAGDLLIADSFMLLERTQLPPEDVQAARQTLNDAIFTVVGGELLDTESAFSDHESTDTLKIAYQKTASYSFVAPLEIGARLAGADDAVIGEFRELGRLLGIGFQMRDDLLGVFGDSGLTGKSVDGDIREGKYTHLVKTFYGQADALQRSEFELVFGDPQLSREGLETARVLLEESGSRAAIEALIGTYHAKATRLVDNLGLEPAYASIYHSLIDTCLDRNI